MQRDHQASADAGSAFIWTKGVAEQFVQPIPIHCFRQLDQSMARIDDRSQLRPEQFQGIESFWSYAKQRLMKSHGLAESTSYLKLKECELRLNGRSDRTCLMLIKMFRNLRQYDART